MKLAIAGASGFVGRALTSHLAKHGHAVVAMARSVKTVSAGVEAVAVDVGDEAATAEALTGIDAAYYLVHSMAAGSDFREADLRLATTFGRAAARAGVHRIIYLGGLGSAPSSSHLASRHEVGVALGEAGVPVVELRAAVVFGSGSISFEMLRYLTERLPAMVCPRWVRTRIQPIALVDLLCYLELSMHVPPGVYEIGGADVTTYRDMIGEYARVRGLRRRLIVDIPWLTPHLSSYWVDLVTPVNRAVSHALVESLVTEVIVEDPEPARRAFGVHPVGVTEALRIALDDQDADVARSIFDRAEGLLDGVYTVAVAARIPDRMQEAVIADLRTIGGEVSWYGADLGWRTRLLLGRLFGERLRPRPADTSDVGAEVDWWRIVRSEPGVIVLRSVGWFPGDAWLGYRVEAGRLHQVAAFRPRGVPGFLYWKLLWPVHRLAFVLMARRRLRRASALAARGSLGSHAVP